MCIIIANTKGLKVPSSVLIKSAELNKDGLGITWLDTGETDYSLSSSDWEVLRVERPYIAHFRYATIGGVCAENTHPFPIGDTGCLLYQNGSNYNLGDTTMTDTEHLADMLAMMDPSVWPDVLEMTDSRYAIIYDDGTYELFNEELWVEKNGVMYSKDNVFDYEVVAVYGTLKRGFHNHHIMGGSKLLGKGRTVNKYNMCGTSIPYVLPTKGGGDNIVVELYMVDKSRMGSVDSLEGHPNWYQRKKTFIRLDNGSVVIAWLYFMMADGYDDGNYYAEFTKGYNPSSLSLHTNYASTTFSAYSCECEAFGDDPKPMQDSYNNEWYCSNCLGTLDNTQAPF